MSEPRTFIPWRYDALARYQGMRRDSGERLDAQFVHHWPVGGGQATRFQQYTETARLIG